MCQWFQGFEAGDFVNKHEFVGASIDSKNHVILNSASWIAFCMFFMGILCD